jgi:hypothetical protein
MSFLAPLWLVLAAAAVVPLLLHLMRRHVGARVEFPAARYLRRAEREHSRSLRLRNLLLMLLRLAIVLALALAAARPFVRGVGGEHGPTALAIVLDNSLSTGAGLDGAAVFDRLRDASAALLRSATPADRLWIVTADGQVRGGTREQLSSELHRLEPVAQRGDLSLALGRAAAAVQGSGFPTRRVAVATDGQQTAWRDATRTAVPIAVFVPAGAPPANRWIQSVSAEPARWTPRGAIVARVATRDSVGYRLLLGDAVLARGIAAPGEAIVVRAAPSQRGWQAGRLELDPDDFHADDARAFALWLGAAPAAVADPSAGPFAATALATLVADGRATSLATIRVASADALAALPALIVPPADPVRLGAANRALARLAVPWRYGAVDRRRALVRGSGLEGVSVLSRYTLLREGTAASDTLATAGGTPWIVGGAGYVLIASPLDPLATDLPVRAPFLPWLASALALRLSATPGDVAAPIDAAPGEPVSLPPGTDALEDPSGARISATAGRVNAPTARGVWFILRSGRRIGALVVEPPAEESVLARWSARELAARLGGPEGAGAPDAARWLRDVYATGAGRPALTPLLLLALLLLGAEAFVIRSTTSTRSTAA